MQTITSFSSGAAEPELLSAVVADYMALDQARIYRRLFVRRFGALASVFGVVGFGLHWVPRSATCLGVALCAALTAWAWIAELRCDSRLARRLNELPAGTTKVVPTRRV